MFCEVYHVLFSCSRVRLRVGDPARVKHHPEGRDIFLTKVKLSFLSEILKKERYQRLLEELTNAPPPVRGFLTPPPGPTR